MAIPAGKQSFDSLPHECFEGHRAITGAFPMTLTITAFERSPDRGKGLARDMRVRGRLKKWASLTTFVLFRSVR